jgi:hypothetical protein
MPVSRREWYETGADIPSIFTPTERTKVPISDLGLSAVVLIKSARARYVLTPHILTRNGKKCKRADEPMSQIRDQKYL